MPNTVDAFLRLVEAGWDTEAARRPHGQHTTVVVHVDVEARAAALHLGPLLSDAERQYLTCDATCEVWFERDGRAHRCRAGPPARSAGGCAAPWSTATACCAVPGCGATRGLHAHHIRHWEDGGPTELDQPGPAVPVSTTGRTTAADITITGPAERSHRHRQRRADHSAPGSLARPPTGPPPDVPPYPGTDRRTRPTGGGTNPSNHNHHQPTISTQTRCGINNLLTAPELPGRRSPLQQTSAGQVLTIRSTGTPASSARWAP